LSLHLLPTLPSARAGLLTRWGEQRYKGIFSLLSGVGFILIVAGYYVGTRGAQLFASIPAARAAAPYAMIIAFILLATSHSPSHIRATLKHPMLIGVLIWAIVHFLANGDLRGSILFGALAAYAVVDLISAVQRGATATFVPTVRADIISIVAGTVVALLLMTFHRTLFGVPVVPFGY
ncbi:MAG: NnrU family protein, partial [Betaproteobacteria bacterium]